jgi:methionyl-tRNA formyltransferase
VAERALRIVLCTNGGLHGALVLDRLLASPRIEIAGLVLSSRVLRANDTFLGGALAYVRRSGIAYATYLWCSTSLADLLLRFSPPGSVSRRAAQRAIPVWSTRRINDAASRDFIRARSPDLLVSAFFNQRIAEDIARIPRLGAVNIHPSALPDFKGVDPVFFAMLRGATTLGVSVHRVSPEWDAGEIVRRDVVPADAGDSVFHATARLYDRGAELLVQALGGIEAGAPADAQGGEGCYDSWPSRVDVASLRRKGVALVRARDLRPMSRVVG